MHLEFNYLFSIPQWKSDLRKNAKISYFAFVSSFLVIRFGFDRGFPELLLFGVKIFVSV